MKRLVVHTVLLGLLFTALPLYAQNSGATTAPNIIQIIVEDIKLGHGAAHEANETGWPKAYRASNVRLNYLAMTSMTGRPEAWYITGYPSMEAWEKQNKAEAADATLSAELQRLSEADAEHVSGVRTVVARFREDLSLRPAINLGEYRYFNMVTVRLKPGQVSKFVEARKMIKAAHEKAGMTDYYGVFEVASGMPGPAYMLVIYMKSLAEADAFPAMHNSAAYKEALGGELGEQKLNGLTGDSVIDNESRLFAISPKTSLPTDAQMAAAPDFWNPKPVVAAATKGKVKQAKKQ
jgi:hypothetical protein